MHIYNISVVRVGRHLLKMHVHSEMHREQECNDVVRSYRMKCNTRHRHTRCLIGKALHSSFQ